MERALCPVLIGRETELTLLEDGLLAANRGDGQIVLLAGEAGLGKTRLATELQRRALKIGMTVLWGSCSEAELALPYLPFLEAIGNHLATSDLERVREKLGPVRRELAHLFPQLEPGVAVRDEGDPTQAKLRLFEAIMSLLRIPAEQQGVLVVLEDLHWSDVSTRELLDYMARRMAGMRAMMLGTYRSDELHRKHPLTPMIQGWRRTKAAEVVELQPLPQQGIAGMVGAIFDYTEITPEFAEFLYGRTEGNPFVLEELLKAALERGDIYRGRERWERKALSDLRLPQTVKDTILMRVERLSAEQAEILQTAAVLGPAWSYQALVVLSGKDESMVQAALHASIQQQLLEEDPATAGRYRFRHALTREAIYDDIITPRREQLHGRAADMLAGQPGTAPMDLTYHFFAANRWADAIPVAIKAAEDAERGQAYQDAAQVYERLLAHVHDDLTRGQLLRRLGDAYLSSFEPSRARGYLEQATTLLEASGQRGEAARARLSLGRAHWLLNHPDVARVEYERARSELEREGPSRDLAYAYIRLAGMHLFEREYPECQAMAERAIQVAAAAGADAARIWARGFLGMALVGQGRLDEGFAMTDDSYQEAVAHGHDWIAGNALFNAMETRSALLRAREALDQLPKFRAVAPGGQPRQLAPYVEGVIWMCLGYPLRARTLLEQALVITQGLASATWEAWTRQWLAMARSSLGETRDAIALMPAAESRKELQDRTTFVQFTIRLQLDLGDVDAAITAALPLFQGRWGTPYELRSLHDVAVEALLRGHRVEEAEQLVTATREAPAVLLPYQDRMEGRLALAKGNLKEARERLRAATGGFEAAGYGLEEMQTRRALAEVELAGSNRNAAEAEFRKVLDMARERSAVFEGDAARRQLAGLGIDVAPVEAPQPQVLVETAERLVTVLFLDIRGYTTMTGREAPDRVAETLGGFYRWAQQEIERHQGLVDKYEGDAVMGTFNVAGARLDHAVQALQAAIAIRDKAAAADVPVGAGIAVGPAVVGKLTSGSPVSTFGEVTNLASRLQAQAAAGEILLSEEAYRRTRDWLRDRGQAIRQESLELKGFPAPARVFRLNAEAPARTSPVRGS